MRPDIDLVDLTLEIRRDLGMSVDEHVTEPSCPECLRADVR